jgi:hypothetical protein
MDALAPYDVILHSFENHIDIIPFDQITMYSGYLCGCPEVPYLPERCIRQFGVLQYIPPPAPVIDSDWISYDIFVDQIVQPTHPATFAAEATTDYLL